MAEKFEIIQETNMSSWINYLHFFLLFCKRFLSSVYVEFLDSMETPLKQMTGPSLHFAELWSREFTPKGVLAKWKFTIQTAFKENTEDQEIMNENFSLSLLNLLDYRIFPMIL